MIRVSTHDGARLSLAPEADQTLAQRIFLAGLWDGVPLCAGLGKCGLCRVRYVEAPPPPNNEDLKRLGALPWTRAGDFPACVRRCRASSSCRSPNAPPRPRGKAVPPEPGT